MRTKFPETIVKSQKLEYERVQKWWMRLAYFFLCRLGEHYYWGDDGQCIYCRRHYNGWWELEQQRNIISTLRGQLDAAEKFALQQLDIRFEREKLLSDLGIDFSSKSK